MTMNNIKMSKFKLQSAISDNRIQENKSNVTKYTGYSKASNSKSNTLCLKWLWSITPTTIWQWKSQCSQTWLQKAPQDFTVLIDTAVIHHTHEW